MTDRLVIDPDLQVALARAGVASAEDLFRLGGARDGVSATRFVDLPVEGTAGRFWLKHYHYGGWRRSRGLLGRGTVWGRAPAVREHEGLAWMRRHGIGAPRPIAAASRTRGGRLTDHAILTEAVPHTEDLARLLAEGAGGPFGDEGWRRSLLARLAADLRRMHEAGFLHRDAHARNVLVRRADPARVWWLDCRRSGRPGRRHQPSFDVAALLLDLEALVPEAEREAFLLDWAGSPNALASVRGGLARDRERHIARRRRRAR